jgi:hypothetical protein
VISIGPSADSLLWPPENAPPRIASTVTPFAVNVNGPLTVGGFCVAVHRTPIDGNPEGRDMVPTHVPEKSVFFGLAGAVGDDKSTPPPPPPHARALIVTIAVMQAYNVFIDMRRDSLSYRFR